MSISRSVHVAGDATVAEWYRRQTTPEYSLAFDLALPASLAGPLLAVLSAPELTVELLKRVTGPIHLAVCEWMKPSTSIAQFAPWAQSDVIAVRWQEAAGSYTQLLWAEPEARAASEIAAALRQAALPGATLYVIASGPLRRWLPAWQRPPFPAQQPLNAGGVVAALNVTGWEVESRIAFHGPRSIAWSWMYRLAEAFGRPDLGDRCLFAMRATYQEPGWLWPLAPLALIRARAS